MDVIVLAALCGLCVVVGLLCVDGRRASPVAALVVAIIAFAVAVLLALLAAARMPEV
jgi:hypothetical protein